MPRHLVADAREWIDEIPTVPIYHPAKAQRERAWDDQLGKKTLLSLTLVVRRGLADLCVLAPSLSSLALICPSECFFF